MIGRAAFAAALSLLAVLPGAAVDGDSMGATLHSRAFTGNPRAVAVAGQLAFVGLDTGLAIHDVSVPGSPVQLGHVYLPSSARDVVLMGNHVLVANDQAGLSVVDVSDPSAPAVVGTLPTAGATAGVDIRGSVALLAEAGTTASPVWGLRTVDVTDPTTPAELAFAPLPNGALCVAVDGTTAYLGLGSNAGSPSLGVVALDVTTPAMPMELGLMPTGLPVNDVAVSGTVALCATGLPLAGELVIADVAAPGAPTPLGRLRLPDAALGVTPSPSVAHVAMRRGGLARVDVSNPLSPTLVDRLTTGRSSWDVALAGSVAWLAERSSAGPGSLTSVDVPAPPSGSSLVGAHPFAEATDVATARFTAFVLRRDGLSVLDTTDPAAPSLLGVWQPPDADFSRIDVEGPQGVVAHGSELRLLDLTNPSAISEQGRVVLEQGTVVDVELAGDTLFAVNGRGMEIFDVTNPAAPTHLSSHAMAGWSSAVAIDGDHALVAGGDVLEILDVSVPASPSLLGTHVAQSSIHGVDALEGIVALTGPGVVVELVDASDPASPILLGSFPGTNGRGVSLQERRAVVAAGEDGLLILDVTAPGAITVESSHDTSGRAFAVDVDCSVVHLTSGEAQHWVFGCDACSSSAQLTCPTDVTIECDESTEPASTGVPATADNREEIVAVTHADVSSPGGCNGTETITRTWTATNTCGNTATCVQTITTVDTTPPALTCPPDTTIECDESDDPTNTGMATAPDCDDDPVMTFADVVIPQACDGQWLIRRTWTATDDCGNAASCTQLIQVRDTTSPAVTCPPDTTVGDVLDSLPEVSGEPTADDCDGVPVVAFSDVEIPGRCPEDTTVTRTWTVTDSCGNSATCQQVLVIQPCCSQRCDEGCGDEDCADSVCAIDPSCCVDAWDAACAQLAVDECGTCPSVGDCCTEHLTPRCNDAECEAQVCALDPYCCDTAWDSGCAGLAASICDICMDPPPEPPTDESCDDCTALRAEVCAALAASGVDPLPEFCAAD